MPRKPGDRIEAPDTLGRKCWADAYLAQRFPPAASAALEQRCAAAGLNVSTFVAEAGRAAPSSLNLCQQVICNCFVNASYDPARSGGCRVDVDKFHYLGFDREGVSHGGDVKYIWHEVICRSDGAPSRVLLTPLPHFHAAHRTRAFSPPRIPSTAPETCVFARCSCVFA